MTVGGLHKVNCKSISENYCNCFERLRRADISTEKYLKRHRRETAMESFISKVAACNFFKRTFITGILL